MHAVVTEIDGAVIDIQEWRVLDPELRGGNPSQPAVDGVGSEVQRRELERSVVDGNGVAKRMDAQDEHRVEEG